MTDENVTKLMVRKQGIIQKELEHLQAGLEANLAAAAAVTEWKHQKYLLGQVEHFKKQIGAKTVSLEFWQSEERVKEWALKSGMAFDPTAKW